MWCKLAFFCLRYVPAHHRQHRYTSTFHPVTINIGPAPTTFTSKTLPIQGTKSKYTVLHSYWITPLTTFQININSKDRIKSEDGWTWGTRDEDGWTWGTRNVIENDSPDQTTDINVAEVISRLTSISVVFTRTLDWGFNLLITHLHNYQWSPQKTYHRHFWPI